MTWCVVLWSVVANPVVPLNEGAEAPFRGLLVPEAYFIELVEAQTKVRELELKLKAAEQTGAAIEQVYRRKLEEAVTVPWYDSPTFNRWLGVLLGGALAGVSVWAVVELQAANR